MLVEQAQKQRNNSTAHLSQHDLPPGRGKTEEELQLFTLPLAPEVLGFLSVLEDTLSFAIFPKAREMVKIPKFLQEKPHLLYAISEKPSSPLLGFLYLTAAFLKSCHSLSIRCYSCLPVSSEPFVTLHFLSLVGFTDIFHLIAEIPCCYLSPVKYFCLSTNSKVTEDLRMK